MSLEYYLVPTHITDNPDDYRAVSRNSKSYTLEDVFKNMTREGSTITTAEAMATFEEITRGITEFLKEGHTVITPLVNLSSSVTGIFKKEDELFDPNRHGVRLNINSGIRLRDIPASIRPTLVQRVKASPAIYYLYDNASETRNKFITTGGGARIKGDLLKYEDEDPEQGIFFINTGDQTEHRVERSPLRNMPKELIFMLPDLPEGEYRLEVRSIPYGASTLRSGRLADPVTVAP